ncbi:putative ATPase of the PP-loop superfamily implicated in cell cycle control [Thioflavicoccus mobilis 8321]|uniref:Putative ATPase of the PP-loop superfamily implicated in cell cycle control n=1 Tax=Thioflavicoccus mobilis 8321 TaxID=765912 RepID=L0GXD5_9GAMM|nr:tRNA 2-thiocytidine(32) synthetase TtcA [Thioflavicoccus mobilis]AGA90025.1 putative ATPase of the PP-loop superfamily implicated in cell cycle control [Thioflavicoccus mobilis 8321]
MSGPRNKTPKPPKSLLRLVGRAVVEYGMIRDGDRILLGVSGGKDSLSLLAILRHLQAYAPVRFELGVVTVDPEVPGFDPAPLKAYYTDLGVPWLYERQPIMKQAEEHMDGDSFCAYCARMKRGIMYRLCRREGYGVLALGQHLDDLAESLLMSIFHGGQLRTMKAHYRNDAGDIRIIRPLAYCRERQTAAFAEAAGLPVVPDSCPACFTKPTRREHMKALLAREEAEHPHLFANVLHAIRPLLTEGEPP